MLDAAIDSFQAHPILYALLGLLLTAIPVLYLMYGDELEDLYKVYVLRGEAEKDMKMAQGVEGKLAAFIQ